MPPSEEQEPFERTTFARKWSIGCVEQPVHGTAVAETTVYWRLTDIRPPKTTTHSVSVVLGPRPEYGDAHANEMVSPSVVGMHPHASRNRRDRRHDGERTGARRR